ncbi:MAG: pirin family protein [Isosphaeraceae bacterium]
MIRVWRGSERGHFDHGWLDTRHTFSFGGYHDRSRMGFRSLRVINDDVIAGGGGFGMHPHEDMEIITYVLDGRLAHRDSLGSHGIIGPGELQHMTAGTGIRHSEFNASETEPVHLYQIWLRPDRPGHTPRYEQVPALPEAPNQFRLAAAPEGEIAPMAIHQDARIYLGTLDPGGSIDQPISPGRHAWLQVFRGRVEVGGVTLEAGDAVAASDESSLAIRGLENAEVMLFDLA